MDQSGFDEKKGRPIITALHSNSIARNGLVAYVIYTILLLNKRAIIRRECTHLSTESETFREWDNKRNEIIEIM